jgi:crotonobetainyl-CoA:carnitine CoA-transferase CaiB-like acyl-CoA transferase
MTVGKRCASLDLASAAGKDRFLKLLAEADVLVSGLRPGALERLGLDEPTLRAASPRLVHARFDAYGWTGPWAARRGFDSLVQMSVGLAAPAIEGGKPAPLPAQALDHGLGYLMAAGVCRALTERARTGTAAVPNVRGSLLGVAAFLRALPRRTLASDAAPPASFPLSVFERTGSAWGPLDRVRCPGSLIAGAAPLWRYEAGPLGTSEASF